MSTPRSPGMTGMALLGSCLGAAALAEPPASLLPFVGQVLEPAQIRLPGIPDDLVFRQRRYKIEALSFEARDETGVDWWGSDEVMVKTTDAGGWSNAETVGDVDSGDVVAFDPATSCIVGVRPGTSVLNQSSVCDEAGRPAPLWFTVELWEDDDLSDFPHGWLPGPEGHYGAAYVPEDAHDDFIGNARLDFAAWELEAALPKVGDDYTETVALNPCGDTICGSAFDGDYRFTYRITRMPDRTIRLPVLLTEAMKRSGSRSAFEAIAAGLTSLPAPQPRKVEPAGAGTARAAE